MLDLLTLIRYVICPSTICSLLRGKFLLEDAMWALARVFSWHAVWKYVQLPATHAWYCLKMIAAIWFYLLQQIWFYRSWHYLGVVVDDRHDCRSVLVMAALVVFVWFSPKHEVLVVSAWWYDGSLKSYLLTEILSASFSLQRIQDYSSNALCAAL